MKKLILGSAILAVLGLSANAMAANTGTVNFTGAVSTATCDLSLKDSNGANIANVDLGVLSSASKIDGTAVAFKLVPQDATCLAKTDASVAWSSPTLSPTGFDNGATNGTNATMSLTATNSTSADKAIKEGNTTVDYTKVVGGIKSFDYSAQLKKPTTGTMTAGAFSA
ncbi:fimbrial protein, partial [Escherichia coli]